MKVAPFMALTQVNLLQSVSLNVVEMKVAPFRALTQCLRFRPYFPFRRRNEGRPIQGIDTENDKTIYWEDLM